MHILKYDKKVHFSKINILKIVILLVLVVHASILSQIRFIVSQISVISVKSEQWHIFVF